MNVTKLNILIICLLAAISSSAAKYQIKVLNTPTITIDKKEAKVGDWFDDQSVIEWSRDNQAMRVVSDANKVYTLSAKLYKEANAKKFADFIAYTKPLASRGVHDATLIEQLQDRFEGHFVMLDEIVIDLSDLDLPEGITFRFSCPKKESYRTNSFKLPVAGDKKIELPFEKIQNLCTYDLKEIILKVDICFEGESYRNLTESFEIDLIHN